MYQLLCPKKALPLAVALLQTAEHGSHEVSVQCVRTHHQETLILK
jgi:hypothetical protein